MKIFKIEDVLKVGYEMVVLIGRNGKKLFWTQESWNPEKNPIRTIATLNKVLIWVAPKARTWLKVSVRIWDQSEGKEKSPNPRVVNGHLEFQTVSRITIRIFDNRNGKARELFAHWVKDKDGTQHPILEIGPEKSLERQQPFSVKMEIPVIKLASTEPRPLPEPTEERIEARPSRKNKQKRRTKEQEIERKKPLARKKCKAKDEFDDLSTLRGVSLDQIAH